MEHLNAISEVVSTIGFPIVCFIMCGWYVKYREDKNDEKIASIVTTHGEESKRLADAVNNNTLAIQKLTDKLAG